MKLELFIGIIPNVNYTTRELFAAHSSCNFNALFIPTRKILASAIQSEIIVSIVTSMGIQMRYNNNTVMQPVIKHGEQMAIGAEKRGSASQQDVK